MILRNYPKKICLVLLFVHRYVRNIYYIRVDTEMDFKYI